MTPTTRAAVYNRFWHTMGGGERHSGMVAQCLARRGVAVDLIGHVPVNLDELGSHLGMDLRGCRLRLVPDTDDASLAQYTAGYDLFVNGSYMSRIRPESTRAAYLCYFPTPADHDLSPWRKRAARVLLPILGRESDSEMTFGLGWYWPESHWLRTWRWTTGEADLVVAPGPERTLHFEVGRHSVGETELLVSAANGETLLDAKVTGRWAPHAIALPASDEPQTLVFKSGSVPAPGSDTRPLGVAVSHARFDSRPGLRRRAAFRLRWIQNVDADLGYLDGYDLVMANSEYTRGWISKLWRRDSEVLYPPIRVDGVHPASDRERSIVTVGRFFAPGLGHSKRQLEQVRLFGRMHRDGLLPGWKLYLIGGSEPKYQAYVDEVRAAAQNLPVEFHINAPRDDLERIISHASIQWSATGYGVDEDAEPWSNEHFGITTVEAMAAGCVPVVIDRAGQREIVRDGIDGFRWKTLEELEQRTIELAGDDALRARMSASAVEAAKTYSEEAFEARLDGLIDRYKLLG